MMSARSESTSMDRPPSPSLAASTAMQMVQLLLPLLMFIMFLLYIVVCSLFQSISYVVQRLVIVKRSDHICSDFNDVKEQLVMKEDDAKEALEKCVSELNQESVGFECFAFARVSDVGMESDNSVSARFHEYSESDASTDLVERDSVEFELPAIARASDVAMETDYPFPALFLPHVQSSKSEVGMKTKHSVISDESKSMNLTRLGSGKGLEFNQEKEIHGFPLKMSDFDNDFGLIFQQQLDAIHKIKMENKHAKIWGLPTILEDLESSKMSEDMKPLKLNNDKLEHKDLVAQVKSFHKIYTERMHKLDIMNQQTLDAFGLIQLNGHAHVGSVQKKRKKMMSMTVGAMKSALSVRYLCAKVSCNEAKVDYNSSRNLMSQLELVYVGQLCLSWEMLNWQYSQAMKLQALDLQASHLYNEVANEFHQFQVELQRFVEHEVSDGPRLRNYVQKRAAFYKILQVPSIRVDCLKDKKLKSGECFVTISRLVRIIDDSRRVFSEFLREKKQGGTTLVVPWDQSSQALLLQAQEKLHKKNKRVRELMRSNVGFAKIICHTKDQLPWSDHELFDARVELKLVARVLSMPEISRDQILWCHKKMDEINLVDRRLYIEPSFLLFPC